MTRNSLATCATVSIWRDGCPVVWFGFGRIPCTCEFFIVVTDKLGLFVVGCHATQQASECTQGRPDEAPVSCFPVLLRLMLCHVPCSAHQLGQDNDKVSRDV